MTEESAPLAGGTNHGAGTGSGPAGTGGPTLAGKASFVGKRVGRFRLLSLLGQGTMGRVFRAEDVDLHRHVALKVIADKSVAGRRPSDRVEQFAREARSAARLEHPHVVTVYEVGRVGEVHYIAMELVEGGNLYDLLKAGGPMDALRACLLCAEAAEALQYAHDHGVLHRDVKPANLMLARGGRCKLADFGLARIDDPNDSFAMQAAGVGTPLYAAPEMIRHEPATARSDVYSLGASLYHLLTGTPPYTAPSAGEVMRRHLNDPVPNLLDKRPDLPPSLADAVRKAMAKDPVDRFESAGRMAAVLRLHTVPVGGSFSGTSSTGMLGGVPDPGSPAGSGRVGAPSASGRLTGLGPSRGRLVAAAAVVLLLLVSAAVYFGFRSATNRGPTPGPTVDQTSAPTVAASGAKAAAGPSTPPPPVVPAPVPGAITPPAPLPAPPAAAAASSDIPVTDTATLTAIAQPADPRYGRDVAIVGVVRAVELSPGGKAYFVNFADVGRDGIFCAYFASKARPFRDAFPGAGDVPNWAGKQVRVEGPVKMYQGRPEILIERPGQVKVVK